MRLILSRKGFDAANGGMPSPILPDGRLIPIPIPDSRSPFRYDSVSVAGEPLQKLLTDLRPNHLNPITQAHLDPDLDHTSVLRPPGWQPMFGQTGAAQAHLLNQGVGPGDLFLFFGWFREVGVMDGRYQFKPTSPDCHVLYGWLQVGEIYQVCEKSEAPDWVRAHVHFQRTGVKKANETIYVSTKRLKLPGLSTSLPGAGLFPAFRPSLCLTAAGRSRSIWRLPDWFWPDGKRPLSYHRKKSRWKRDGKSVILHTAPRGQEFVLQGQDYPQIVKWALKLFKDVVN